MVQRCTSMVEKKMRAVNMCKITRPPVDIFVNQTALKLWLAIKGQFFIH